MHVTPAGRSILLAAVTILAVGACGGEDEPTAEPTTAGPTSAAPTAEPSPTPTPTPTPEQPELDPVSDDAVIAAYLDAKDAYVAAYNPPAPELPALLDWWDGPALEAAQNELRRLASEGRSEVIEYGLHPEVIINEQGAVAVVNDCYDVHVETRDTETGDPVDDATYVRNSDFTLEFRDDRWVVVNFSHKEAECTPGG